MSAVIIVVAASFTLSFTALSDLARMSGAIPDRLTWLLPVVIDVFILQATWCVYAATTPASDTTSRCWRSPAQSVSPAMMRPGFPGGSGYGIPTRCWSARD